MCSMACRRALGKGQTIEACVRDLAHPEEGLLVQKALPVGVCQRPDLRLSLSALCTMCSIVRAPSRHTLASFA